MKLLRTALLFSLFVGVVKGHGAHEPHELKAQKVLVAQITSIFSEFEAQKVESSFASFVVNSDGEKLNLRLSIEDGRPGLDWELLAKKNIADEEVFLTFAEAKGFTVTKKSVNGIVYLRAENTQLNSQSDVASLCVGLLIQQYGLSPNSEVDLHAKNVRLIGKQF